MKLTAGRETDELLARTVLDWTSFIGTGGGTYWNNEEGNYMGGGYSNPVPPLSEDIAYAWWIIENLRSKGLDVELRSTYDLLARKKTWSFTIMDMRDFEPLVCNGVGYVSGDTEKKWQWFAKADTAPLAICQAAYDYNVEAGQ